MPQLRKNADTDIATDVLGAEFTKKNSGTSDLGNTHYVN